MKNKVCEEHDIKFPNSAGLEHHILEIHYGLLIDEIEKKMYAK